jgi:hypothetical protein
MLQDFIYGNFLKGNNSQIRIWSSLLLRSAQEDSKEIYFVFFWYLKDFLWNLGSLKQFLAFNEFKRNKKTNWLEGRKWPTACCYSSAQNHKLAQAPEWLKACGAVWVRPVHGLCVRVGAASSQPAHSPSQRAASSCWGGGGGSSPKLQCEAALRG